MARNATKSTAVAARSSSKRAAAETPSRQSKRAKAARKSYVEPASDEESEDAHSEDNDLTKESDYGGESENDVTSDSAPEEEASSEDNDSKVAKGSVRGRSGKRTVLPLHKKNDDEQELWKVGAKLEPGTRVIIKKPKAREAGDTPYTDETIHPNTMHFLKDLRTHNDRQWLKGKRFLVTSALPLSIYSFLKAGMKHCNPTHHHPPRPSGRATRTKVTCTWTTPDFESYRCNSPGRR
jgi:hypothetical protein